MRSRSTESTLRTRRVSPGDPRTHSDFSGWGRTTSSVAEDCLVSSFAELAQAITTAGQRGVVARGFGRAAGDASQNAGGRVIRLAGEFSEPAVHWIDWERRVARVSAGASFAAVMQALVSQGWFLPTPGTTGHMSVGGGFASDYLTAAQPRRGSLAANTEAVGLVDGQGRELRLEPRGKSAPEFWATAAGLGMTGIITSLDVRVVPVTSAWMVVESARHDDIDAVLADLEKASEQYPYSYALLDTSASGEYLGRGIVSAARHAVVSELPEHRQHEALNFDRVSGRGKRRQVPDQLLRPVTSRLVQSLAFRAAPRREVEQLQPASMFFHVDDRSSWTSPLSELGLLTYQVSIPNDRADLVGHLLESLTNERIVSQRCLLMKLSNHQSGALSFESPGWAVSIEFPHQGQRLSAILDDFDEQLASAGGRTALSNDARVRADAVPGMYPDLPVWQSARSRQDPDRRFRSDLTGRLEL
ncbi:MAG: FAD-binding protein [Candidatus Nanopelagicales bacterium]